MISLPVEYFEFTRGIQWSVPYFDLPWETDPTQLVMLVSAFPEKPRLYGSKHDVALYGLPLTLMEYNSLFESPAMKPEAEYLSDSHNSKGWKDFG